MWNPYIKVIHITKLVQMMVKTWFVYFEYVSYLSCGITLIVFNYCFDLIAINFNWSTWPWSIVQREISSAKLHKSLLTCSICHSAFLHCTNLFVCFSCVFTLLEIMKHNMPKMLPFSSIFNIKMSTKIHQFWCFFLHACWYDSCHIQSNKIVSNEVKDN